MKKTILILFIVLFTGTLSWATPTAPTKGTVTDNSSIAGKYVLIQSWTDTGIAGATVYTVDLRDVSQFTSVIFEINDYYNYDLSAIHAYVGMSLTSAGDIANPLDLLSATSTDTHICTTAGLTSTGICWFGWTRMSSPFRYLQVTVAGDGTNTARIKCAILGVSY